MIVSYVSDGENGYTCIEQKDIWEVALARIGDWWDVRTGSEEGVQGDMLLCGLCIWMQKYTSDQSATVNVL